MKLPDNENLTAVREKILPVLKKYRVVLAVLLAGVLLLTSGHSGNTEQVQTASADTTVSQSFDLNDFQQELQARLAAISGAGRVELMRRSTRPRNRSTRSTPARQAGVTAAAGKAM